MTHSTGNLDDDRIKEIGPNLACAEWLMKNGAKIKWKGCKEYVSHYDCLPNTTSTHLKQFKIEHVYAGKEASISHIGFKYFKDCHNISNMEFDGCSSIDNEALDELIILKDYLKCLKINDCKNVSDQGIMSLEQLKALKYLELKNVKCLIKPERMIGLLKTKLPEYVDIAGSSSRVQNKFLPQYTTPSLVVICSGLQLA
ncbi:hypothetical protein ACI65C_001518 [Semiaphis heraclei]